MQRHQLEHIIRAASSVANERFIVVIGSQAILGKHPDAPGDLLASIEADVFVKDNPAASNLIDGSIGENSPFHETFGYYAHGVGADTAVLTKGWEDRLIPIENHNTGGGVGLCLDPADLGLSKLIAGREKDLVFVEGMLRHRLTDSRIVLERLQSISLTDEVRALAEDRLRRLSP